MSSWIYLLWLIVFSFEYGYVKMKIKANCLGKFCNSDPSLVSNFQLKVSCQKSKPCIEAHWATSEIFNPSPITQYQLQYRIVWPMSLRSKYAVHEITNTMFRMNTNNKPSHGVTYEFKVAKHFKGKYGKFSVKNISLPESVPFDSPKDLRITEINSSSIIIAWKAPNPIYQNGVITHYEVRYYALKHEEKTESMINITDTSVILSKLFFGEYKIFVRAYTKVGAGIWSNPLYFYRPTVQDLPIPKNVKAYRESSTELEIKWTLPDLIGKTKESLNIVGYVIFYSMRSLNPKWTKYFTESADLKATIKGLNPFTTYQVKVAALNSQGLIGNLSNSVEETTNKLPRLNDQTVRKLRCSVVNSKVLMLEWLSPMITADIYRFEVFYSGRINYISTMNLKKSEFINKIKVFVDFEPNIDTYSVKLEDLQPNAVYTIAVRTTYKQDSKENLFQSLLQTTCRTNPSLPNSVDAPIPLSSPQYQGVVKLKLLRCSERNGPLINYTIVVGRYRPKNIYQFTTLKEPDEYKLMELISNTKMKKYTAPYIAISRSVDNVFRERGKNWTEVILGNNIIEYDMSRHAINKRLDPNIYYKAFVRVCMEELKKIICKSSNWSDAFIVEETKDSKYVGTTYVSKIKGLKTLSNDFNYTIVLIALLMSGVTLTIVCVVVICTVKRKKRKKRIIKISKTNQMHLVNSPEPVKSSLTNGIRSNDKSDIELLKNHQNKYLTAPDLVTADSVLMCQDGLKLTPILVNGLKRKTVTSKLLENNIDNPEKPHTSICDLYQYISNLKANDGALLQSEFETLNTNLDDRFTWQQSNIDCNKSKNRYANVVAYDHTAVTLQPFEGITGSDYINANYIDGYQKKNAYIATQGPLPDTIDDFWRMVWEQNTTSIVMMTRLEERSGVKCHQYWPNRGFITYDQMIVSHIESFSFSYYTIRLFELQHKKYSEKREIHHFQFTAWPDHGVPKLSTPLLMFIRRYRSMMKVDSGPTVVHCSAGVGRTGAFIVIEAQLERIKHEKNIDVFNYISKIRCQRNYMVQTQAQYLFILETLLEAIEDGNTEVIACNLHSHVSKLSQIGLTGANELSGFELEFSKLNSLASNRDRHGVMLADFVKAVGNQSVNLTKNKIRNIIPYDWNRVVLPTIRGVIGSDYINASYIDGYRDRRAYIAAQSPLPSTVEDFWRMVWDQRCGVLVVLNQPHEEKCHIYWPVHKSIRYQFFVVDPVVEYNMPNYILREFKVTDARDGEFRTLRQFQFTQWPSRGCPKESDSILDFIRQVHKTKEQFGHMEPMIVHCSTGSGRTGVFIALSIVIGRLQQESVVDMYQTVKLLHKQRLGLVQTEEQYEFCYKALVDYLALYEKNDKECNY